LVLLPLQVHGIGKDKTEGTAKLFEKNVKILTDNLETIPKNRPWDHQLYQEQDLQFW